MTRPGARWTTSTELRPTRAESSVELEPVEPELEPARQDAEVALLLDERQAVVVGRRPPELQPRPGDEQVAPVDRELAQDAGVEVDDGARAAGLEHAVAGRPVARPRARRGPRRRQRELLPGDLVPGRRPLGRLAQEEAERDEALAGSLAGSRSVTSSVSPGRTRSAGRSPPRAPLAVDGQLPFAAVARRGS